MRLIKQGTSKKAELAITKSYLITGASRGLGLTIAQCLLASGNNVIAINRSISPDLELLSKTYDKQLLILLFDLKSPENLYQYLKNNIGFTISIIGFVNNAAIDYIDLISNFRFEQVHELYKVNVFSPMVLTKFILRNMVFHNTAGSIIHISSICAHTGYKGFAAYASTKGALEAFSKNTAREWGEKGIRSNCIVPGFMETEMSSTISEDQKRSIYGRTALKEPVSKESVAETVLFLLSEKASSITGQNIFVDSGTI